tara:strand:+ start:3981 stop:4823 length:843 start_codon:yes stop_codon:yes gene_type:complete
MQVVFDIGGTKTRIVVSEDGFSFKKPIVFRTEQDFANQKKKLKEATASLIQDRRINSVAGGIAGPLNKGKNKLINSPHIPGYVGIDLVDELEDVFDAPVYLENDSAIVGLGEATAGAGRGYNIVAYITVSTGVGGARIVDGKIDNKTIGFEPGHQIINFDGPKCLSCDGTGHLEYYISGNSLERKFNKKPYDIHDASVWEREARILAIGLHNIIVLWSPDCIVLGGSMIVGNPGIDVAHVERHLKNTTHIFPELPKIKEAELKDVGGLHGALAHIKNQKV